MNPYADYRPVSGRNSRLKTVTFIVVIAATIAGLTFIKSRQEEARRTMREGFRTGWTAGTRDEALKSAIAANDYHAVIQRLPQVPRGDLRQDMLTAAILAKKPQALKAFLDSGYDVEGQGHNGKPLLTAVINMQSEAVKALLDRKANANAVNEQGQTALFFAANFSKGGEDIVRMLLDAGAEPNGKVPGTDIYDKKLKRARWPTPVCAAVMNNRLDVATLLLDRKASLAPPEGFPPLLLFSVARNTNRPRSPWRFETLPLVELLLKHGANIEEQGQVAILARNLKRQAIKGTPLYIAAKKGDLKMVQLLLRYGADPSTVCEKGLRPVDVAEGEILAEMRKGKQTKIG